MLSTFGQNLLSMPPTIPSLPKMFASEEKSGPARKITNSSSVIIGSREVKNLHYFRTIAASIMGTDIFHATLSILAAMSPGFSLTKTRTTFYGYPKIIWNAG